MIQIKQMAGVNSPALHYESEILRIRGNDGLQNTKRAQFGLNVFKGNRGVHTFANLSLTSFFSRQLVLKIKQSSREQFVSLRVILTRRAGRLAKRICY